MTDTPPTALPGWNHVPPVPLQVSPLFHWPPRPLAILRWFWDSWFLLSEKLIILGLAFVAVWWMQPPLEVTRDLAPGWIAQIWARNMGLIILVAGGLHLYFYGWSAQGKQLRYDARPLMVKGRQFTLGGQIRDNMFWTLASGVTVWTAYEVLIFWAMGNGWAPVLDWADSPWWFVAIFFLVPLWESFHFYWIHRLIHLPFLYRHVHSLHHRNVNVGPWSGLSMHPVEHLIFLSAGLIFLLVPAAPVHVIFLMQYLTLTAATTHTGFAGLLLRDENRLRLGTFHHQMHHRYFECNYGSLEIPWDKLFGSFHDGTVEANERMKERRKRIAGN